MTKIVGRGFVAEGTLEGFDEGSSEVVFIFSYGQSVEIKITDPKMLISLQSVGLARLANATIDFVKGSIALNGTKEDKITVPTRRRGIN